MPCPCNDSTANRLAKLIYFTKSLHFRPERCNLSRCTALWPQRHSRGVQGAAGDSGRWSRAPHRRYPAFGFRLPGLLLTPGHIGKVSIRSPTMLHLGGGRGGISREHYPELDPQFYQDVADAYAAELRSLATAGCT
jgi:hypothetical protein